MIDNYGRKIDYVRLAVTDRCNLRCFYCMPEEGINYVPRRVLMTYEEMELTVRLLVSMGIRKLRITGGEPFLRKDLDQFMERLAQIDQLEKINITTNGTLTAPYIPLFKKWRINAVNLSLDTLDKDRFFEITRRTGFEKVMKTFDLLLTHRIPTKINMVVMQGRNIDDIIPMVELARDYPVSVRFIEEMPFNGEGNHYQQFEWNYIKILEHIKEHYPDVEKIPDPPHSTSYNYQIPGFQGTFGIIAAFSRTFCGTCNRIRITPKGMLKTCLYDQGIFNIKELIRAGASDDQLKMAVAEAIGNRAKNGFEAEQRRFGGPASESMATIGG